MNEAGKPAHIGLVVPGFGQDGDNRGIPILADLVVRLVQQYQVTVYALRFPPMRSTFHSSGAEVFALGGAGVTGLSRLVFLAKSYRYITHHARITGVNLLHGFWADEPGFLAATAARRLGIPSIVTLMGGELVGLEEINYGGQLSRINPLLSRIGTKLARRVTAGSRSMVELFTQVVRTQPPIHLPLGVDEAQFTLPSHQRSLPKPGGEFRLLAVGSLVPVKDHHTLLKAFALLAPGNQDITLHVVGEGRLKSDLEREAETLGIAGKVVLHGYIPRERLVTHYREADVFIQSSRFESQAIVLLEAACFALPVIGTQVGLIPELKPAVLDVPVADPAALATAILKLRLDKDLRLQLGRALESKVIDRYTLSRTIADLTRLYRELLEG
jgi:glycosyltransferase involved in cell wall biosynthesis